MSNPKKRGKQPAPSKSAFSKPSDPPDYNEETPKFCLNFLRPGFDVQSLDQEGQAAFARTLQKLASSKWKDLITAPKHGQGTEFIPRGKIKPPVPPRFEGEDRFMVFRYHGKLPMAGVRIRDVYHVLWIESQFGYLYDHD
jgi:hypothetical protein